MSVKRIYQQSIRDQISAGAVSLKDALAGKLPFTAGREAWDVSSGTKRKWARAAVAAEAGR